MKFDLQREWQRFHKLCSLPNARTRTRLTFASGALFSGVLLLRFMPLPGAGAFMPKTALNAELTRSTGLVRQSIIDLYRIQRSQQVAAPAEPAAEASAAPATTASGTAAAPPPSAPVAATTIDDVLEMRVAIARNVSTLTVGVNSGGVVMNTSGQGHCELPSQGSVVVRPTAQGLQAGNCQLSTAAWVEAPDGYVYVGDSWFKGRVLLLNNGGQLLAVNYVILREYLSSVVGSEMYPDWPLEALKAQAIAARSYALTHHVRPASDYFDVDNTQRFQAYKGVGVETNMTQAAVAATLGEFISYKGGIVESLYAASDQIVQEAHGGQGMSQHGAKDHALRGYSYQQILSVYYPGTSLSRLVVE